jgi:hypothetical protein
MDAETTEVGGENRRRGETKRNRCGVPAQRNRQARMARAKETDAAAGWNEKKQIPRRDTAEHRSRERNTERNTHTHHASASERMRTPEHTRARNPEHASTRTCTRPRTERNPARAQVCTGEHGRGQVGRGPRMSNPNLGAHSTRTFIRASAAPKRLRVHEND